MAIYRATEKLLAEHPFADLSVAQIIEEAGLSRASFYHYFSSKLGVVAGLLISVMDEVFTAASPFIVRPGMTLTESLQASIRGALELWTQHRVLLRVTMENWPSSDELEAQWRNAMTYFADAIADEIDEQRAAGALPDGLPSTELATALVWSTERCLYIAGRRSEIDSTDEIEWVDVLVALWAGTLKLDQDKLN
ncbi:TetR/AcrR family transcriptional regulator [Micromonospora sp. WMMD736]|uniref:TetR/AcrR family transcriptional regulator n=1 Tax=Micromonospora sp. WMMD736 TaxID=3404112 RepID=UPI003B954E94